VHTCSGGTCQVGTCDPGFSNQNAPGNADGCEYSCPVFPPQTETCNGVDDDCDGLVDGNDPSMVVPSNFCVQIGPCAGSSPVCQGSRGWVCNYGPDIDVNANGTVSVIERRCDGKDNNCNTQIDETFPLKGQPCTNGEGRCARSTTYTCRPDETAVECLAVPVPTDAIDEDCNAIDDNCDGQIDESDPLAGAQCYNGGQHQCLGWIDPMVQVGSKWVYTYEASRPAASNTDPGVEDTRACSKANVLPWTSLNQAEAEAACSAVVDGAGQPMRLCTVTEWETACRVGTSGTVYSYSNASTTYVSGRCNDVNALVGGPWPTGRNGAGNPNTCYANWGGASRIYDLSGNVSEWTGSAETVFGNTYYRVRGGNYQTFPLGTQCGFNFVLQRPEFQNFDLGFRCCSDNAP
jgi:hypothetical protein